ncbi:MAG: sel1 repeat family protein [Muribaculaceae bacterium]|nr:sel1 repeat family protein [Muribaculaceae bacterium]
MKKLLPVLLFLAVAASVRAVTPDHNKANAIFESVKSSYSHGNISADSLVNIALFHKVGNPEVAARCLRLAADAGNPRALTELGVIYAFSPAFSSRTDEGVSLLKAAADAGYKEADGYLGYYYFQKSKFSDALKYLEAAAPLTMGIEYATLGSMYLQGKGVKESGSKARENFHRSAMLGLPRGMSLYASLLGTKNGGAINYPDAFFWFYIAGELGDNYSRVMLYRPMLPQEQTDNEVSNDTRKALTWIEAVHSGKSMKNEPLYKEGFLKGLKARELAAEKGDDWSRFYLGGMNYNGDFLNQNYAQALRYYEAIARHDSLPRPMLAIVHERLADMYRDGKGTRKDTRLAERHTRLAATYGSLPAYTLTQSLPH